ncbi:MAG: site-specific integrase, partial [Thermoanaerobaculia bacterium]|nr:site-specific integrase [Thermoanaerobaculia bacterium]
ADDPATTAAFARFQALRPLFVVAFHTGLRRGDLLALAWSSVDLDAGVIRVTMQKTRKDAVIPISTACREALLACRARAPEHPRVFSDADGHPVSETIFALAFSTAKVIAGITRRFRPHDMRHTFASQLASEGVSLQVIASALGHSTITLTQRYAKPNEESLRAIAAVLNRQTEPSEA